MRSWALYAVCAWAALATTVPADAACCCSHRLFTSGYSYVFTEGCEGLDCGPGDQGHTEDMTGLFWILGDGNPIHSLGIDNGRFAVDGDPGFSSNRGWLYVYPGYPAVISSTWCGSAYIDGRPDFAADPRRCMALILEDRAPGTTGSSLAVLTAAPDNLANYWFQTDGDFVLRPTPAPRIVASQRSSPSEVSLALQLPGSSELLGSLYLDPECTDVIEGATIYGRAVQQGVPPGDDPQEWTVLTEVLPLGETTTVTVDCSDPALEVYLAQRLRFESGFETAFLSRPTTRIECDPTLADPAPLFRELPRNRERRNRRTG